MGIIDSENLKYHLRYISNALLRRGLMPDPESEWEIHGPHSPDMPYVVYVGHAIPSNDKEKCRAFGCNLPWKKCKIHNNYYCIAIYPKAVYEIDDTAEWAKVRPEDRIPVLRY